MLLRDSFSKAEVFAKHLEPNSGSDQLPEIAHNEYTDVIPPVTVQEVKREIGKLSTNSFKENE